MKAVILAAGYATRLYPLTLNKAKPLLAVGGRAIIDHTMKGLSGIKDIDMVYVVTNEKFNRDFSEWREKSEYKKKITIVNDKTKSDDDKLGAIGDIDLVINSLGINDDLIVVAGDNLFSFELKKFAEFFKKYGLSVAAYRYPKKEELNQFGIIQLGENNKVIGFQEKPKEPKSDFVAVCLYGFPKDKIGIVAEYMESETNHDAPGYYLQWLVERGADLSAFVFDEEWYDIGAKEAYEHAQKNYR